MTIPNIIYYLKQQHLQVSNGETNLTAHKCQRYYDLQEKAQGYAMVRDRECWWICYSK